MRYPAHEKRSSTSLKPPTPFAPHANRAKLIRSKITQYATNPASQANNVKRLTGVDALRFARRRLRVIFSETAEKITVIDIGARAATSTIKRGISHARNDQIPEWRRDRVLSRDEYDRLIAADEDMKDAKTGPPHHRADRERRGNRSDRGRA